MDVVCHKHRDIGRIIPMWPAITSGHSRNWRVLYRAAVAETDNGRVSQRISEAEHAVISRVRELFYVPGKMEEKEELKHALYRLRALRGASDNLGVADPSHMKEAA
jgi:hypothetical protein